mmetsp:Transcript_7737/g.14049  ORF Transcript_7737/g.14049 Transcript_7737/m.14049 type:complete len:80 (+) Transcript_7737:823-1062(+)
MNEYITESNRINDDNSCYNGMNVDHRGMKYQMTEFNRWNSVMVVIPTIHVSFGNDSNMWIVCAAVLFLFNLYNINQMPP